MRGMAHLGVLQLLEEERIAVDYIAGCSIGSLIGALYACGHDPGMLIKLAQQMKKRHVLDFIVPKMGLFSGDKILEMMELLTKRCNFEDLKIPLCVLATDLNKGKSVVLDQGAVSCAVRASVSVPGIFVPYQIGDAVLVDGAVMNPTPIDTAFSMGADVVIAVDLSQENTDFPLENMFDVLMKSIDIMEYELIKNRATKEGTVLIRPQIAHIASSSFEHVEECVQLGKAAAKEMLPELYHLLGR